MSLSRTASLAPVVFAILLATPASAAEPPSDLAERVDRHLAPYLETGNFSGVVFAASGNDVLLAKAYGMASLELGVANEVDTVFHLASVSKPFTTAAVLLLEQDGVLSVSDPLAKFVPDFPRADQITLHHLMVHSTGIPNINAMPIYGELSCSPQTPESLVAAFRDAPPEFEPGDRYRYSNSNYNLLALVVERASGISFGEFLERRIFAPLGMRDSADHADAARVVARAADGYSPVGLGDLERAPWLDWSVKTGNGSLYSTVRDLHRFALAVQNRTLLDEASVEKMLTDHLEGAGYGWFVRERHDRPQVHINGRSPGFTSYLGIYPDDNLIVVVLGNLYNSVATEIGVAVAGHAFGLAHEPPTFTRRALSAEETARIVGRYAFGPDFYAPNRVLEVVAEEGYLFDGGDWLMPTRDSTSTFIHRRYSSVLEFAEPVDGRYTELRFDSFVGRRLED